MKLQYVTLLFYWFIMNYYYTIANDVDIEENILKIFIEPILENSSRITTTECYDDNQLYKQALFNAETWAVEMYDASEKIPFGIVTGNFVHLGNYDQCLDVKSENGGISGKACVVMINFTFFKSPENNNATSLLSPFLKAAVSKFRYERYDFVVPYMWLWCVPSACGPEDISHSLESALEDLRHDTSIDFDIVIDDDSCSTLETPSADLDSGDWLFISILIIIGSAVIFSTAYDLCTMEKSAVICTHSKYMAMTSFSLYSNWKSLFSTRSNSDDLKSLYAIRFLSMCLIVYVHAVFPINVLVPWMPIGPVITQKGWTCDLLAKFNLAVDTFLLLGGIVLVYTQLGHQEKNAEGYRLNILTFYIHRYMRIAPSYMTIVGLYATILRMFGSGPTWNKLLTKFRQDGRADWWYHILFISNYAPLPMSIPHTWYLDLDMQLHWIAPIFLYPLLYKGIRHRSTIVIFSTGISISILSIFFNILFNQLPDLSSNIGLPEISADPEQLYYYLRYIYFPLYSRMAVFWLGLLFGYFIKYFKKNSPKIALVWIIFGWILAIILLIIVLFIPTRLRYYDEGYNLIEASFYGAFYRITFAASIGWIIFAIELGYSGPIGKLLMWPVWIPLGKLTFSIYLLHATVIACDIATSRTPPSHYTWDVNDSFITIMVLTMIPAITLCLCVEMPFGKLSRLLAKKTTRSKLENCQEHNKIININLETIRGGRRE